MADDAGQSPTDLTRVVAGWHQAPETLGFFELLRRLEGPGSRIGRAGGLSHEPVRLGQRARLNFSTRDVPEVRIVPDRPPQVNVDVLGLFGPEGPMPLHMTRWIMERLSERWFETGSDSETSDTTFIDFANMLQHRLLALYWRGWADARPEVQIEHGPEGRTRAMLDALAGIGLPGLQGKSGDTQDARLMRRHATDLGQSVHGVERLTRLVADLLGASVRLAEFVGEWLDIPARLQTRIGTAHAHLGHSAVAGRRVFQRQSRAEIVVGPLGLGAYERLIDDRKLRARLARTVLFAVGREIDYDLRPVLRRGEVPPLALGVGGRPARLGLTAWLPGRPDRDAADLVVRSVTAAVPAGAGA